MISLQYDPYKNFATSTTPVGLYAWQKWLGQEQDAAWQDAFNRCVASLMEGGLAVHSPEFKRERSRRYKQRSQVICYPSFTCTEYCSYAYGGKPVKDSGQLGNMGGLGPLLSDGKRTGHLNLPLADRQLEKAFSLLVHTQNEDGTWGDIEREWNTFLVVHAMKNKKMLV